MASWYYMEAGQTRGPVDDDAIRVLASAGRLNPASSLMMAGSSEWSTVGAFEAILGLQRTPSGSYAPAGAPPPPPPPPPGYADSTAGLCAAAAWLRRPATWVRRLAHGYGHAA